MPSLTRASAKERVAHDSSTRIRTDEQAKIATEYAHQAERLGFRLPRSFDYDSIIDEAADAKFVTAQDPVIETSTGERLPTVPVSEAVKLNALKDRMQGKDPSKRPPIRAGTRHARDGKVHGALPNSKMSPSYQSDAALYEAVPPAFTNPLFPPLPTYGPPTPLRRLQCRLFRISSFFLSLCFLIVIVLGLIFTSIPGAIKFAWLRLLGRDPAVGRPFYEEEQRRQKVRAEKEALWEARAHRRKRRMSGSEHEEEGDDEDDFYTPSEGGPDPLVCDPAYYARRVGLDIETFDVQTEDGFSIQLLHVYDPKEYVPLRPELRQQQSADLFRDSKASNSPKGNAAKQFKDGHRRYPVLLMHGLLQSAGAFCTNDDDSLAFFLAKSGYDVWLGNNRCGFEPKHNMLPYGDPRMWAWNIRQMGVMDLPALICRVLEETGFPKLGLICHSQGTTQTFVALAKEQRPDIGDKISVFCALAPAVYAGPLISKIYFKIMRAITPAMFRLVFGIHAFIPLMPQMHLILPSSFYGFLGYNVFSFLFNWSDERWERALRDRMFQWAPTYVSAESMRWWLGRECFAKQRCILATRAEGRLEDEEDQEEDDYFNLVPNAQSVADLSCHCTGHYHREHGRYAWYDERAPPMAFWIAGHDDLVDGRRLLKRFERGREPKVDLVHSKIIEGYEHLDVIWSMDMLEKVGQEVREVVWRTASTESKRVCRTPVGCERVKQWVPPSKQGNLIDVTSGEWHEDVEDLPAKKLDATYDAGSSSR